jgi:hypothetical protein
LRKYQQDAIRLLIRNFRRPEEIPPEVWEGLVRGQLEQVAGRHLDRISEMAPQLCQALDFWDRPDFASETLMRAQEERREGTKV